MFCWDWDLSDLVCIGGAVFISLNPRKSLDKMMIILHPCNRASGKTNSFFLFVNLALKPHSALIYSLIVVSSEIAHLTHRPFNNQLWENAFIIFHRIWNGARMVTGVLLCTRASSCLFPSLFGCFSWEQCQRHLLRFHILYNNTFLKSF